MKKSVFILTLSSFLVLSACSVIIPGHNDEHDKKMTEVTEKLGFGPDYTPEYFSSPTNYINILNNNNFHLDTGLFTTDDSPSIETPVKIAWDSYIAKDSDGREIAPDYALVVIPGSAGSYIKFAEYIYDLDKTSNQKIAFFMMDHRGQGFSTWFNPKNRKGFNGLYVDNFENYIKDLKYFYDNIVKPRVIQLDLKYDKHIPIYIYGHSLGGGIAAKYLETYPEDFDGAVLSSPAIKPLHWLNRSIAYVGIFGIIMHGGGAEYVPWGEDIHEVLPSSSIFCNTSSEKRWQYWQKVSDPSYYNNKDLIHPNSGGEVIRMSFPTFWWTYQLIIGTDPISSPENAKKVKVPYLILSAAKEELISLEALGTFLKNTPDGLGSIVIYPNGKHDIMLADDKIRNESINEIVDFLKGNTEIPRRKTLNKRGNVKILVTQSEKKQDKTDNKETSNKS